MAERGPDDKSPGRRNVNADTLPDRSRPAFRILPGADHALA